MLWIANLLRENFATVYFVNLFIHALDVNIFEIMLNVAIRIAETLYGIILALVLSTCTGMHFPF